MSVKRTQSHLYKVWRQQSLELVSDNLCLVKCSVDNDLLQHWPCTYAAPVVKIDHVPILEQLAVRAVGTQALLFASHNVQTEMSDCSFGACKLDRPISDCVRQPLWTLQS